MSAQRDQLKSELDALLTQKETAEAAISTELQSIKDLEEQIEAKRREIKASYQGIPPANRG